MDRFSRIELLLGPERMKKLRGAFVTVVGLGAVGGYVVEALARSGVGRLRLVDFDRVEPTNLNRNIFALESTLHRPKAEVAAERVRGVNPDCAVEAMERFAAEETFDAILDPQPDMLVDAIDSVGPKTGLLLAAWRRGIPVVTAMGAASRTDPFQIRMADLFATRHCPLARRIRKGLRKEGVTGGVTCFYSEEPHDHAAATEPDTFSEGPVQRGRKRQALGSLPTLPGIMGLMIAHRVIQVLTGTAVVTEPSGHAFNAEWRTADEMGENEPAVSEEDDS